MAVVIADPKAIAARKGGVLVSRDPKQVAKARKVQEQAAQWRREHNLSQGANRRTDR